MTPEEKQIIKDLLREKYEKALEEVKSTFDKAMLRAEYNNNLKKVEEGINPFEKPDNTDYQCIGCGS